MLLSIYTSPLDKCEPAIQLTHFMQLISFYIFQKHKKNQLSSDALGGTEREETEGMEWINVNSRQMKLIKSWCETTGEESKVSQYNNQIFLETL